jgi:hypothetical protein
MAKLINELLLLTCMGAFIASVFRAICADLRAPHCAQSWPAKPIRVIIPRDHAGDLSQCALRHCRGF